MPEPAMISGAVWSSDAVPFDVEVRMNSGGTRRIVIIARSLVAAHNLAIAHLRDMGESDILFVKSVTRTESESEL